MEIYFTVYSDYHLVYNIGLFIHTTRSKTLEFKSVIKSHPYVYAFKVLFKVYKMGSNLRLYSNNYTKKMFEIIVDSESCVIVKHNRLFLFGSLILKCSQKFIKDVNTFFTRLTMQLNFWKLYNKCFTFLLDKIYV